jgi:CHAT domain-containing protein
LRFDHYLCYNFINSLKISFFDTFTKSYLVLQKVLIQQNKINQALEIAERGRARAFIELLATRQGENLDPQININPPNITKIKEIAKQQNATLVEYTLISEKELYIWVIKPTGEINFKQVESQYNFNILTQRTREDLKVDSLRNQGNNQQFNFDFLNLFHQILIEPIAKFLPTDPNEKIIFIPHQELFLIPFPTLKDDQGQYLIDKHTILTAPSIQSLELTHNIKQNRVNYQGENLIIGNPTMPSIADLENQNLQRRPLAPLPYAETEALKIANLFNTQALIGDRATEESIKPRLSNAQIIHFATHGLLYYGDPTESAVKDVPRAIALAPTATEDGFLTSSEILGLKLKADLVVLSACQTGKGRITGDGVIGLSRSFISAGVPSVLVSLWSVDDESTSELMIEFYQNLQNGMDKAQALRQAMLTLKANQPQPKYWAAFTLIGNY